MGWKELEIDYFVPTCNEIIGGFLSTHGFKVEPARATRARYRLGNVILACGYHVEDSPDFYVLLAIGLVGNGGERTVAFSRGIQPSIPEQDYGRWHFSSEGELRIALARIRDLVLAKSGPSLWTDEAAVEALITSSAREVEERAAAETRARHVEEARAAFRRRDYDRASRHYAAAGKLELSRADTLRRRIASARAKGGDTPNEG